MSGKHILWLVNAVLVVAGVRYYKGYQSASYVFHLGVLAGTRYALCQHMRCRSAQENQSPIYHCI